MSDADNIIRLPRPEGARRPAQELGFFLRVGRNDHRAMLELFGQGEQRFFGLVVEAQKTGRHRDLRIEARKRAVDLILDPKTHHLATLGGYNHTLGELPWGKERPHRSDDFSGAEGAAQADRIVSFAEEHAYTQLLGPTHYLQRHDDPWLAVDIEMMAEVQRRIGQGSDKIDLIYPLSVSIETLREPAYRRSLIEALRNAPCDAMWLKIDNFGADASGEKTVAYIEACREFQRLGVPLIADHVGGLPALGALAFGAVGGIAHGITMYEGFKAAPMRKPRTSNSARIPAVRFYIPRLDAHLSRAEAKLLFSASTRIKDRFACTDTHCCTGIKGQLDRPARHFVHERSKQVTRISGFPRCNPGGRVSRAVCAPGVRLRRLACKCGKSTG